MNTNEERISHEIGFLDNYNYLLGDSGNTFESPRASDGTVTTPSSVVDSTSPIDTGFASGGQGAGPVDASLAQQQVTGYIFDSASSNVTKSIISPPP